MERLGFLRNIVWVWKTSIQLEVTHKLDPNSIPKRQQEAAFVVLSDCLNFVVVLRADGPLPATSAKRLKVRGH